MGGTITRRGDPGQNFDETSLSAQHSVELSRNAKGDYAWAIKLYCQDGEGQKMLDSLEDMAAWLEKRYGSKSEREG